MVNGPFTGTKERRSFKPKVASSILVGRMGRSAGKCRPFRRRDPAKASPSARITQERRKPRPAHRPLRRMHASLRRLAATGRSFVSSPTADRDGGYCRSDAKTFDGKTLQVRRTTHDGGIPKGTKTGTISPSRAASFRAGDLAWMLEAKVGLSGSDCRRLLIPSGHLHASAGSTTILGSHPN